MTRMRINQMANKYMNHEMISLHTELPEFPDGRISLLYAVLSHQPAAASQKELLSLVTSLVQMGLDTHDMVDNEPNTAKGGMLGMRAQQLKVLAGDYFSSRFYHLLSQAGQIESIRHISEAVCDINRIKMNFYAKMKQMKLNAEEYLHYGVALKSGLFLSFTGFMSGLYERLWPELVERFSRCEMLLQELRRVEKLSALEGSWGVWHVLQEGTEEDRQALGNRGEDLSLIKSLLHKYEVADKLGALLRQSTGQLQTLLQRLQSDKLLRELQPLIEPFLQATGPQRVTALKELG
ncbi:heptaprenyl diphosphate synthase component 1 [Cohnella silvisoli]|uniref:Heptaprenyl diphosphate synthase component 1 n=1 Tax=Cohnella silvisoli TaxID=2873699 RepID=A0ABV1KN96_9BACL|nr:heptaprenyl diphosphate synthase component 1 [Cohnella silvisoli]MCD9021204.1 heptaprenyl diphosphate synthase component 1 [Cohnella silvisoli]